MTRKLSEKRLKQLNEFKDYAKHALIFCESYEYWDSKIVETEEEIDDRLSREHDIRQLNLLKLT